MTNPLEFIRSVALPEAETELETEAPTAEPLNLDKLPNGVVSGTTLIDFSNVPSMAVRTGVSLSMLFASRVATKAMKPGDDEDDWLAAYTDNLSKLGFSLTQSSVVQSKFKKTGLFVHEAIIPFLTMAFGGAAIGPVILEGLKQLKEIDKNAPWITLFDRESRRFDVKELHFAAVSSNETDTSIRYAIARLKIATNQVTVLFFKLTKNEAQFESVTRTMSANNSLLAVVEPDLRAKLGALTKSFILEADL